MDERPVPWDRGHRDRLWTAADRVAEAMVAILDAQADENGHYFRGGSGPAGVSYFTRGGVLHPEQYRQAVEKTESLEGKEFHRAAIALDDLAQQDPEAAAVLAEAILTLE
jgi:hypothetical protein